MTVPPPRDLVPAGRPEVRWHPANPDADTALRLHLAELPGAAEVTVVGRLCPACGSTAHGRPWARRDGVEVHVSLSRAGGHLVTAVCTSGPIGIDIEVIADVTRGWDPAMVLADGEVAATPDQQAWVWAAKEAVLKRRGAGLDTPMGQVRLTDEAGLSLLPAPAGLIAALAGPRVADLLRAGAAAPAGAARRRTER